jgi:hypothetical protein
MPQQMCPYCSSLTRGHCPDTNPHCPWRVCSRKACAAVLNFTKRQGFIMVGSAALPMRWQA